MNDIYGYIIFTYYDYVLFEVGGTSSRQPAVGGMVSPYS